MWCTSLQYHHSRFFLQQKKNRIFGAGGANIAVQFVLNYEEGGESCLLNGDSSSENLLSDIVGKILVRILVAWLLIFSNFLRHRDTRQDSTLTRATGSSSYN